MAQKCFKCKLKEMVIINSPQWSNVDVFDPCELSMKVICRACGDNYKITRNFDSLREYESFLDKYEDDY